MNWVDRKFAKQDNLEKASGDVWNNAMDAIHGATNSFIAKGGDAKFIPQNGHRILIEVVTAKNDTADMIMADQFRRVTATFDRDKPAIATTLDAEKAKTFLIEADENHCFLKYNGHEISFDEFSQIVLDDAFFKPKKYVPARQVRPILRRSAWG